MKFAGPANPTLGRLEPGTILAHRSCTGPRWRGCVTVRRPSSGRSGRTGRGAKKSRKPPFSGRLTREGPSSGGNNHGGNEIELAAHRRSGFEPYCLVVHISGGFDLMTANRWQSHGCGSSSAQEPWKTPSPGSPRAFPFSRSGPSLPLDPARPRKSLSLPPISASSCSSGSCPPG